MTLSLQSNLYFPQWMEEQVLRGRLPGFADRLGSWRPDFLVADENNNDENFRITEINARFSFNGFLHAAYGQGAVDEMLRDAGAAPSDLACATSADEVS
jgi:hypothetical protein